MKLFVKDGCADRELLLISRKAMVESAIDSLDALRSGDFEPAELMLASTINSQAQTIFRQPTASAKELSDAKEWQSRMRSHNARLKLQEAESGP